MNITLGIHHFRQPNLKPNFSVLIVCSPLSSPTTNRIINQYKHYQLTKILLIDIIGNVFNYENRLYKNFNTTEQNDLLVLTFLTQKFKHILNKRYHVEFSRYLNMRSSHVKFNLNNESGCDLGKHNRTHYQEILKNFTLCQNTIKEQCNNYSIEDVQSLCTSIAAPTIQSESEQEPLNVNVFNEQLMFSENLNLFDFLTTLSREEKNENNKKLQFDFIVLDFKSLLGSANSSIEFWRPLMILEQSISDRSIFTMHRALSERDVFVEWLPSKLWKCNRVCWSIIAAIFLILISLVLLISVSAGIAAR